MKNSKLRFLSAITAAFVLLTAYTGSFSVSAFENGESVGIGTVQSSTKQTLGKGLTYSTAVVRASNASRNHNIKAVTFNPLTSDYMPLVYSQYSGYGSRTLRAAQNAEKKYGYDVKAGANGSFFVLSGGNIQGSTYGGVNISDGKIIQGCNDYEPSFMLTFDSVGKSALVYSRVAYQLKLNGEEKVNALENININSTAGKTNWGIYYSDTSCGDKTDTKEAGVEIVFNKLNNTELIVGGTLMGEVVEIRSNVSKGGSIGLNQFVLYASDPSSWASTLRALKIGDKAEITCTETIAAAKTAMENCNSAIVTYGYHLIEEGKNVTSSNPLGESFNKARAQRTAIGVKADGTLILAAMPGRTSEYPGMTLYEVADFLLSQGCVTGINLDGGGSTQMTIENSSGVLEETLSSSRSVANSILVVQRPTASDNILLEKRKTLNNLLNQISNTTEAYAYGRNVYQTETSMPGDYTRAIMRVQQELENTVPVTGVTVSPTSKTLTTKGETFTLQATVIPDNATDSSVNFSSDNTAAATVDSNGTVTAVANGEASITATTVSGGKTAVCVVTVALPHEHDYDTATWKFDANVHWHECRAGDGAKIDESTHVDADRSGKCDVCEYGMEVAPVPCVVNFEANGGFGTMEPVYVNEATDFVLPSCGFTAPDGKTFKAWEIGGVEYAAGASCFVNTDVVVRALWKDIVSVPCIVNFEANGGFGTMEPVYVNEATDFVLPSCGFTAPDGKTFKAWEIGGVEYAAGASCFVNADVVVRALWKDIVVTADYTVTVDNGSGDGNYEAGQMVTITADSMTDQLFSKWLVASGNISLVNEEASSTSFIMPASDVTIQALYVRNDSGWSGGSGIPKNPTSTKPTETPNQEKTGWIKDAGKWYFMDQSGVMKTGWIKDAGKWYFTDQSGVMKTGWIKDAGKWYFTDQSGAMKTGWIKDAGKWYFTDQSGVMKTGWIKDAGKWYFTDQSGVMKTGWIKDAGKWYYFYADGKMAADTTIDGYIVGTDGVWAK